MAANLPISSREYKLILNCDQFADREAGKQAFWKLIAFLVERQEGQAKIQNDNHEEFRETWYLDTPSRDFQRQGYIIRVRKEKKGEDNEFKLTLKYRSGDRYLAASKDVASVHGGETKFEEDIVPPFISKFSQSTSVKLEKLPDVSTVGALERLFPGLGTLQLLPALPVGPVGDFKAQEYAHKFGKLKFPNGDNSLSVKAAFSFWYLSDAVKDLPVIGEFSFNYEIEPPPTQLEEFPIRLVDQTNRFFNSLQSQTGWLNLNAQTKTALALESV